MEMAGDKAAFETRDFYLACFLRCTGYDLMDLRAEGRRKVFVFRDAKIKITPCREDRAIRSPPVSKKLVAASTSRFPCRFLVGRDPRN
jgi:hypothetical protein